MKKGVFTAMNYWMPLRGALSMHCSANEGAGGDVSLFFGLSGTGKTTLSSDPRRRLIGDDEHAWSDRGVFNIEGGCYAKCIGLRESQEPQIHRAIRFGAVLENVVFDPETRVPDYDDRSITENTRACYPIEHIDGAIDPLRGRPSPQHHLPDLRRVRRPAAGQPPDARPGDVPFPERLHRQGGRDRSRCVRAPGHVLGLLRRGVPGLHPVRYAEMLAERIEQHQVGAWLINTGWTGGPYGVGSRMKLSHTRAIIDAIHDGSLKSTVRARTRSSASMCRRRAPACRTICSSRERPGRDPAAYDQTARKLAGQFRENFAQYADQASEEIRRAGPRA